VDIWRVKSVTIGEHSKVHSRMADDKDDKNCIGKFDCTSDPATLGSRWERWLKSFEFFADGRGLILDGTTENKTSHRRRALMLHSAGEEVQDIFSTLPDTDTITNYIAAVNALNAYFVPKVNATYARHAFQQLSQRPGETVRQFATRLQQAAKDCAYAADENNQVRDAILSKCTSRYIIQKLLEAGRDLDLTRALEIADQCEEVTSQMAKLSVGGAEGGAEGGAGVVNKIGERRSQDAYGNRGRKPYTPYTKTDKTHVTCYRCGFKGHYGRDPECPAKGKTCTKMSWCKPFFYSMQNQASKH
jgi:hypothetical protein